MDLLFKNPTYFFFTYFSFEYDKVILFTMLLMIVAWLALFSHEQVHRRIVKSGLLAGYYGFLLGVTVWNVNRSGMTGLNLSPIPEIYRIFVEQNVHTTRAAVSNIILFIPCGVVLKICFPKMKRKWIVAVALGSSMCVEGLQYILQQGYSETMDILYNVAGAFLGAMLWSMVTNRICKN